MNGGSASALSMCISRICRQHTDGDVGAAESAFHEIVSNGVAGWMENISFVFDGEEDDNYAIAPKRDGNKDLKWLGLA